MEKPGSEVYKIFVGEEEIQIHSPGQLDEIILTLEEQLRLQDRRTTEYRTTLTKLYELYALYNQITGHQSYRI